MLGILARQIGIKSNHNTVSAFHDEARAKIWHSHRRGHKAKLAIGPYIIDYDHVIQGDFMLFSYNLATK